ncbi:MAG: hypothetical protein GXX84_11865 [Acidobacteria bacterium]|nr:hypothetical protein [Acidobacteriota bacterium]
MLYLQITSVSLSWLRRWGGGALVLLGLMDGTLIPLPGGTDMCTALLAATHKNLWFYYALMATAGSVSGGYFIYRVARKGGKETLEQRFPKERLDKVYGLFGKWGFGTVLVSALLPPPFPTLPFLAGAGALNYPARKFVIALAAARFIRFVAVAYLASVYGRQIRTLLQNVQGGFTVLITVAVFTLIAAAAIYLFYRSKSRNAV